MKLILNAALAAAGLALRATQALAGTIVKVEMVGEGGGAMSYTVDQPAIPAGKMRFLVDNSPMTESHEMVLIKLKSADVAIPLIAAKHRVDEKPLKSMGEAPDVKLGATGELDVKLKPGDYMILYNIKGHCEAGMRSKLKVVAAN